MYVHNRQPTALKYHLGPVTKYTVVNAQAIGACLAVHMILCTNGPTPCTITINIDSQATIRGLNIKHPKLGQYLIEKFLDLSNKLTEQNPGIQLKVNWISAHDGVEGNERADEEAKDAARGNGSPPRDLPAFLRKGELLLSVMAIKQILTDNLNKKWAKGWEELPHH